MKYIVLFLSLLCFLSCRTQSRVIYQDLSFLYNPDSPVLKHKVMFEKDSVFLYLSLSKSEKLKSFDSYKNRYKLSGHKSYTYSGGELVKLDSVPMRLDRFWEVILKYHLQEGKPEEVFFVKIDDKSRLQVHLLDLGQVFRKSSPEKNFMLTDSLNQPNIATYFYAKQDFKLNAGLYHNTDSVFFHYYKYNFPSADPPYLIKNTSQAVNRILPDSSGFLSNDGFMSFNEGVVMLTSNQKTPGCFSYLLKNDKYPQPTNSRELVESLVYLTSESEFKRLQNEKNYKVAVDNFWIEIGGSMEYSRKLVQYYYSRVEYANRFFTSYKEGWKTDRGMIFIVMGKPDYVTKSGSDEIWQYDQIFNKEFVTFTFRKQPIFLSNDNYELQRSENYQKLWKALIEDWRKGIIIKNNNL
jgi:GWxTD domain-containing protein